MRSAMVFRFLPFLLLLMLSGVACHEPDVRDPDNHSGNGGDVDDDTGKDGDGDGDGKKDGDGNDAPPERIRFPDGTPGADENDAPPIGGLPDDLPEGVEFHDLGLVPIINGVSPEIELDIDSPVYSFIVIGYAHDGISVMLHKAVSPTGEEVVSTEAPPGLSQQEQQVARGFPGQFFSPNRVIPSRNNGAFLVPNTPDVQFPQGTWTFQVGAFTSSLSGPTGISVTPSNRPIRVVVLVNTAPKRPQVGTLDLTLWFTGSDDYTASMAPDDPQFQQALNVMRDAYDAVGVTIADIEYRDLDDPSLRTIVLNDTCEGGDLDPLFMSSAGGSSDRLNIFFVERFQCLIGGIWDMGQGIAGISGGIPGMPYAKGTEHSGVAAATAFFLNDPQMFAVVLAHEMGHFLGLYHTQENNMFGQGPPIHDNISDTPEGAAASSNLMYFQAQEVTTLTPGQGFVVRNNSWVQP